MLEQEKVNDAENLDILMNQIENASSFFLVCSNPRRLLILCLLIKYGRLSVGEISHHVPVLSQSALSQHLAVLRAESIVVVEKEKQSCYYSIADPSIREVLLKFREIYCNR